MTQHFSAEDIVLLPVPVQHAVRVADFVKQLRTGGGADQPVGDAELIAVAEQGVWSQAQLNELVENLNYPGVVALLDACAAQPGTWVLKSTVEENEGITPIQLRNELGAFSKTVRKLFGEVKWPMEWKKRSGKYSYRMDEKMSAWWTAARGASL